MDLEYKIIGYIFMYNRAELIFEDYNQFPAVMTSEGIIRWETGGKEKSPFLILLTLLVFIMLL